MEKEKEMENLEYQLRAIAGDCGPGGLNAEADVLPINKEHWPHIRQYMRAQLEHRLLCADLDARGEGWNQPEMSAVCDALNDIGNRLIEMGAFHHKWHKRSEWVLEEVPAEEEIDGPVELHLIRIEEEA